MPSSGRDWIRKVFLASVEVSTGDFGITLLARRSLLIRRETPGQ
jgi:hypothetical protein